MYNTKIIGLGHYAPALSVSNDDLAKHIETSDEWIYSRTGIRNRHIAVDEAAHDLAAKAGQMALDEAGIKAEDVDMIIAGTISNQYITPSMACLVQKILGADQALCFDVNAACSGFVYGLDIAEQFIKTGKYKNALVIGSERLSQILNWEDRGTCVLFGDGAGAAVIERSEMPGILGTINLSVGKDFECLYSRSFENKTPYYEGNDEHYLTMNGQVVFQFACTKVPEVMHQLLDEQNINIEDIDYFVLHQANSRIIAKIAKRLKVDINKFFMNMDVYGNTSAASVPIALSELSKKNDLTGKKVMIAGFGAGLTYGASLLQF